MSLQGSPTNSPQRIAAFASPTARHGAQLLDSIADHQANGRAGDFPVVEILEHDCETQDRCECGSDAGWWRLVGGSKARIKQREGRSDKTVGEVVVCFDCAMGRSHPPISNYVDPARTTWKMHISFLKHQLDTARQNADRIQLVSDVETIPSLYPAPPLIPPLDFSLADLDAFRTTQNTMFDVINDFGHGLSSMSRRNAPAAEVQDFCRQALASGTPVVVTGIPDDQLEQWRWSKNEDERGAIWRETQPGALRLKAKCRHGRKRVESTNLTIEKALNLVNGNDGSSDKDVIQIADWPHDREHLMSEVLPLSLPSYNSMAPDSDTMDILDGLMNLDSKMYKIERPPETGPLFYCGTPGTVTAGHCDSSSAKNDYVMDMAPVGTPEDDKGALWIVFLRDDLDKVLAVLARRRKVTLEDVICSHKILLERDDVLDLLKDGVKVLYHMQRLGESIIVPAGCYHIVYNWSANGKIAADYVSLAEVDAVAKVDRLRRTYYASSDEQEAGDIARLPVRVLRFLVDVDVDALLGVQRRNALELFGE